MLKQDRCLSRLQAAFSEGHEESFELLLEALSLKTHTPRERIVATVKQELRALILGMEKELLGSPLDSNASRVVLERLRLQPFYFPKEELKKLEIQFSEKVENAELCFLIKKYIDRHSQFEKRLDWLMKPSRFEEVQALDPKKDCDQIYHFLTYEFRTEMKIFSVLYEIRALIAVNATSFFLNTGEFAERSVKRLVDTVLLVANALEWGIESERGRKCMEKVNAIHSRYSIPNDLFKFVLTGLMFIPEDWNQKLGWRPLTPVEKQGWFFAMLKIGRAMGVGDLSDSYEETRAWYDDYSEKNVGYHPLKRKLFDQIVGQVLATYPEEIRPLVLNALIVGLDEPYRISTGFPLPPDEVTTAARAVFFTMGQLASFLPRKPWIRTLQSSIVYPDGYEIEELGVHRRSNEMPAADLEGPTRQYGLEEVAQKSQGDELWVIIRGSVYDLTTFAKDHPGGEKILRKYAGADASEAFDAAHHSDSTLTLMANYRIGEVMKESHSQGGCPFSQMRMMSGVSKEKEQVHAEV